MMIWRMSLRWRSSTRRARRRPSAGFDACGEFARVVPPRAAAADRPHQVAERAVAEKVERLVGDLKARAGGVGGAERAGLLRRGLAGRRDEPLLGEPLDDALNQA